MNGAPMTSQQVLMLLPSCFCSLQAGVVADVPVLVPGWQGSR